MKGPMTVLARAVAVAGVVSIMAIAAASAPAADFQRTLTFQEPLGYTWTDELIHRDETIAEPHVAADTLALTDADGKAVPLQVEVLVGGRDAVRSVRLWFKMTLPQGKEVAYRLTYNDAGRAARQPAEAVTITRGEDRLIISSGAVDLAVAAPKSLPAPLDASAALGAGLAAAPAPILGVRPAGAPEWSGAWTLSGPARVKEIRTTVATAGPVWAEIRLNYLFEDRQQGYDVAIRMVRGDPWIDVTEKSRLPAGSRMTAVFRPSRASGSSDGPRRRPAEALWMPWYVASDGRAEPAYNVLRLMLDDRVPLGEPFAMLRPKRAAMPNSTQVLLAIGSGEGGSAVGAIMTRAGEWVRPYDQFPTARVLETRDGLSLDFPLGDGERRWALVAGPIGRFDTKAKLQHLIRAHADIPLDRVLAEWILRWPRVAEDPAPHIATTWRRILEIRDSFAANRSDPTVNLIKRTLSGDLPGDKAQAEFLIGRRASLGGEPLSAVWLLDRCYQDDALAPGAYPRRLAAAMRLADLSAAGRPAGDAAAAFFGYVFSDPNFWPGYTHGWDAGDPSANSDMHEVALDAAAMMPDHPHSGRWAAPALAGLREDLVRSLASPDGAGTECPGRQAAALTTALGRMQTAQNAGLDDLFRLPQVPAALEFLRNLHTPPDPRLGRRNLAPIGDTGPWQDETGLLFGMAARGLGRADWKFAARCMAMYREYSAGKGSGNLLRDVLAVDPSAPTGVLEEAPWPSRAWSGFGAVLRSRFGTPHEAFAAFKCGPAREGYHGDELSFHFFGAAMPVALDWQCGASLRPDQEHMHNRVNLGDDENMDSTGDLLAVATSPAGDVAVGQVRSDRLRKMPHYPQEIARQAAFPWRTLPASPGRSPATPGQSPAEARYRRFLLLVKHPGAGEGGPAAGSPEDYLVIRDELAAAEPATFNLFVLARSVRQEGQLFRFDGQLAADAVAFFATPDAPKVKLDRWAWPKQDSSSMIPEGFQIGKDTWRVGELQQWLRVTAAPGEPFLVVLYPYRKGAAVPKFESLAGGKGVRVSLGEVSEEVYLATDPAPGAGGQAVVRRQGRSTVILKSGSISP